MSFSVRGGSAYDNFPVELIEEMKHSGTYVMGRISFKPYSVLVSFWKESIWFQFESPREAIISGVNYCICLSLHVSFFYENSLTRGPFRTLYTLLSWGLWPQCLVCSLQCLRRPSRKQGVATRSGTCVFWMLTDLDHFYLQGWWEGSLQEDKEVADVITKTADYRYGPFVFALYSLVSFWINLLLTLYTLSVSQLLSLSSR